MSLHSSGLFSLWAASGSIDRPRMVCFAFLARAQNARSLGARIFFLGALVGRIQSGVTSLIKTLRCRGRRVFQIDFAFLCVPRVLCERQSFFLFRPKAGRFTPWAAARNGGSGEGFWLFLCYLLLYPIPDDGGHAGERQKAAEEVRDGRIAR